MMAAAPIIGAGRKEGEGGDLMVGPEEGDILYPGGEGKGRAWDWGKIYNSPK